MISGGFGVLVLMVLLAAVSLVAGVVLVRVGHFPRRRGDEPRCRLCEYNLTGIAIDRCPECGAILSESLIVRGERHRRGILTFAGVMAIALGVGALAPALSAIWIGVNWLKIKPDFMLMNDVASGGSRVSAREWLEIVNRDILGTLSQGNHDRLVELALREQVVPGTGSATSMLIDYLGNQYIQDRLSETQKQSFIKHIIQTKLQVRPRVAVGDSIPFRVEQSNRAPSAWWITIGDTQAAVDNVEVMSGMSGSSSMQGVGSGGGMGAAIPPQPIGTHELSALWKFDVYQGSFGDIQNSRLLFRHEEKLKGSFEVLPEAKGDYLRPIDDPAIAQRVQYAITPMGFRFGAGLANRLGGHLNVANLPQDIAFEVFARIDDREIHLGNVVARAGMPASRHLVGSPPISTPLGPAVDIILRSSENVAKQSVDIEQFWKGELIYRHVPVKINPTTQP